jgi:hypothetical protein
MLAPCFAYSSILNMQAKYSSETSVAFYELPGVISQMIITAERTSNPAKLKKNHDPVLL